MTSEPNWRLQLDEVEAAYDAIFPELVEYSNIVVRNTTVEPVYEEEVALNMNVSVKFPPANRPPLLPLLEIEDFQLEPEDAPAPKSSNDLNPK